MEWCAIIGEVAHVTEASSPCFEALAVSGQAHASGRKRCGVSIQAEDLSLCMTEESLRVPTSTQRAIQVLPMEVHPDELRDGVA